MADGQEKIFDSLQESCEEMIILLKTDRQPCHTSWWLLLDKRAQEIQLYFEDLRTGKTCPTYQRKP